MRWKKGGMGDSELQEEYHPRKQQLRFKMHGERTGQCGMTLKAVGVVCY